MAAVRAHFGPSSPSNQIATAAMQHVTQPAARAAVSARHTSPEVFVAGNDLKLTIAAPTAHEAILWYRHVNHGERWLSEPMQRAGSGFTAHIPGSYTQSPYPLQYYFELRTTAAATLHPAFNATLSNQPYYAINKRA